MAGTSLLRPNLLEDIILQNSYNLGNFTEHRTSLLEIPPWSTFGKFFDFSEQSNYVPRPDNKHYVFFLLRKPWNDLHIFQLKQKKANLDFF